MQKQIVSDFENARKTDKTLAEKRKGFLIDFK